MSGSGNPRLRWRLTVGLVFVAGLLLLASVALLVNPAARSKSTAQNSGPGATATGNVGPTPNATRSAAGKPGSGTVSPTPTPTRVPAQPTAAPTHPPTSNAAPPGSGYFSVRPVGSWSALPSDAQCAAQVHYSSWEPRPENSQQNNTKPAPGAMAAAFSSRPRNQGGSYNALWDSWLLRRVDGQFTGTTDQIFQWAACKWGLPDNLIRATAVEESTWFQYLHFPADAAYGGGGGSCYWDWGCGDAFSAPTAASTLYCNSIATQGLLSSEIHNYQRDPLTTAGRYPYTPTSGMCPKTFSILGVMSWDNPAWQAPYPAYAGNQNGTFPYTRDSTAAAADYFGAYIRGCYEGWETWMKGSGTGTYAAGDLWGCVGSWYSGDWHTSAANTYIGHVQNNLNTHIWLTAEFDNPRAQYSCDAKYGCPS